MNCFKTLSLLGAMILLNSGCNLFAKKAASAPVSAEGSSTLVSATPDPTASPVPATWGSAIMYFGATQDNVNWKLFKYDGTQVSQVTDLVSGGNDYPNSLVNIGSNIFFVANASPGVQRIYEYDGTTLRGLCGLCDSPSGLQVVNTNLFFTAVNHNSGLSEIYVFNGESTVALDSFNGVGFTYTDLGGGKVFISGGDANGTPVSLIYDSGTLTIATQFSDLGLTVNALTDNNGNAIPFPTFNGSILIPATDPGQGVSELYSFDGTTATLIVAGNSKGKPFGFQNPSHFTVLGDQVVIPQNRIMDSYSISNVAQIGDYGSLGDIGVMGVAGSNLYYQVCSGAGCSFFQYDGTSVSTLGISSSALLNSEYPAGTDGMLIEMQLNGAQDTDLLYLAGPSGLTQISAANTSHPYDMTLFHNGYLYAAESDSAGGQIFWYHDSHSESLDIINAKNANKTPYAFSSLVSGSTNSFIIIDP